jgi:hypothetical protein
MPGLTIQRTEDASLDIRLQSDWYDVHAGADISERYLLSLVEHSMIWPRSLTLAVSANFETGVLRGCGLSRFKAHFTSTLSSIV